MSSARGGALFFAVLLEGGKAAGERLHRLELIADRHGEAYAYDLNTNTNYNSRAEANTRFSGMGAVAQYLGSELEFQTGRPYQPDLAQIA